jgi:hypothetical protein
VNNEAREGERAGLVAAIREDGGCYSLVRLVF